MTHVLGACTTAYKRIKRILEINEERRVVSSGSGKLHHDSKRNVCMIG